MQVQIIRGVKLGSWLCRVRNPHAHLFCSSRQTTAAHATPVSSYLHGLHAGELVTSSQQPCGRLPAGGCWHCWPEAAVGKQRSWSLQHGAVLLR